ncbi:MAG: Endonuclease NucS [Candidatus Bathyarchaeota archaeon BA1]|nr:MAG: Endonuclease NucS [Candidatus Bathyarchaeota archaeon BA1]
MRESPIRILENPTLEEVAELAKECISKHTVLVIVGNCWVEYKGRASSKLGPGERILIIKRDGALLVHRPEGYEPVNWMPGGDVIYHIKLIKREANSTRRPPFETEKRGRYKFRSTARHSPGCIFQTRAVENILQIRAIRRRPSESVRIFFDRIYILSILSLIDAGEFSLYASEEDMQKAIVLKPSMLEPGFQPITYEKKIEPGFVDVYGIDGDGKFVVVEIKRKTAGRGAALQLATYVKSVKGMVNREVRGILAAPSMARGVQRLLATLGLDFKPLDPRKCAEVLSRPETRKLADFFEGHR